MPEGAVRAAPHPFRLMRGSDTCGECGELLCAAIHEPPLPKWIKCDRPEEKEMPERPLDRYHQQRDALVGRTADHLKAPSTYTRGTVPREERQHHVFPWLRILMTVLFFVLWMFVYLYGFIDWSN